MTCSSPNSCCSPIDDMPLRPRILVAESRGFSERALRLLSAAGEVELADLSAAALPAAARHADVLWVRLRHHVGREVMAEAPALRFVVSPTTGLNHIDVEEARRRGIRVLSLRGESEFLRDIRATAELTIGLMLALLRRIPEAVAHVRAGFWDRDMFKGGELYGRTVGLVGYGRLGRILGRTLSAFDARVVAHDPFVSPAEFERPVVCMPLHELLTGADIVSLHAALREESRGFFGRREFQTMKHGALFVNTARGELLDEGALLNALESRALGGAALDVLAGESSDGMAGHPLVRYAATHSNLLITPHVGGCTHESMGKTELFLARKLCAELGGTDIGAGGD